MSLTQEKNHSLIADTELKIDPFKRKMEATFNQPFFNKILNIFKSLNDHKFSSNKLDTTKKCGAN